MGEEQEKDQGVERIGSLEMVALEKVYPSPLMSHVGVSTNPVGFYDTLRRLHSALGTRFMYVHMHATLNYLFILQLQIMFSFYNNFVKDSCDWREGAQLASVVCPSHSKGRPGKGN